AVTTPRHFKELHHPAPDRHLDVRHNVFAIERLHEASIRRIHGIDKAAKHVRGHGATVSIPGNELHIHRPERLWQEHRPCNLALLQVPESEGASQFDVTWPNVERRYGVDEVARDQQIAAEVRRDAMWIETVDRWIDRMLCHQAEITI